TEMSLEVSSMAVQVHGGMGFIEETGVAQMYRDAKILTIYEGTTAIQANDLVGRKILRENGETLRELIADMRATTDAVRGDGTLGQIADTLTDAIDALESATDWLLANGRERLAEVLAGAVPYLYLLGTVSGGWQLARLALAARGGLAAGQGDGAYLTSLVDLVRFYMATIGPQALAHAETVREAGAALNHFDEASF
ncbi:MAG: acyl-CoA dehydrogenase, partial [Rhodocyclaceae bacterium]|nr:acyl-CoA dehydrogenase [Rhodocyclaceae bacterium]